MENNKLRVFISKSTDKIQRKINKWLNEQFHQKRWIEIEEIKLHMDEECIFIISVLYTVKNL